MNVAGLKALVETGYPLIAIESRDEPRCVRTVREAAAESCVPVTTWSATEGMVEG